MERVRSRQRLAPAEEPLLPKQGSPQSPPRQPSTRRRPAGFLMAFLAAIVTIHVSASLLAGEPIVEPPGVAWADLQLGGDSAAAALAASLPLPPADPLAAPALIPRIIHHLFNATDEPSPAVRASYSRWRSANPGWELRFYQEDEAAAHVGRWFPQYTAVYDALRSEGERRDLFRYLAVLRHGGLFADAGVAAPRPLAEVVRPEDTLVTAWDTEFPSGQAAISRCHVRARQLQHALFAAAPGHPALAVVVERVAATLDTQFSMHPAIDAAERTGPGVFTDAVLKHAREHPPAMAGAEGHWGVRLMPRKAFGDAPPAPCDAPWDAPAGGQEAGPQGRAAERGSSLSSSGLEDSSSMGSIRSTRSGVGTDAAGRQPRKQLRQGDTATAAAGGASGLSVPRRLARWWSSLWGASSTASRSADEGASWRHVSRPDVAVAAHLERVTAAHEERQLFPVSAAFEPPFDVMTHLVSHGERQSGWDVSQTVTTLGAWQPSVQPGRRPSLAEALVGSLGVAAGSSTNTSTNSSSAVGVGVNRGKGLVFVDVGAGYGIVSLAAAARGHRVHAFELGPGSASALEAAIERNGFGPLVQLHRTPLGGPAQRGPACLELHAGAAAEASAATTLPPNVEMARGYSDPAAHGATGAACVRSALRLPGAEAIPPGERVGALRVSANGWEGHVIEGFLPLLRTQRPPVVAVEWSPAAMRAVGYTSPLALLRLLRSLGYDDVSHSGFICDERWYAATYGVRRTGGGGGGERPEEMAGLAQPTWCRLLPEDYSLLLEKANSKYPETLLFINKESGRAGPSAAAAAAGRDQEGSGDSADAPEMALDVEDDYAVVDSSGEDDAVDDGEELTRPLEEVEVEEVEEAGGDDYRPAAKEGATAGTATEEDLADGEEAVRALAADDAAAASLDDPDPSPEEQEDEEVEAER